MIIAVCSDEVYAVNNVAIAELERLGHEVVRFGALASGADEPWAEVGRDAARAVADGRCAEGVFFCWSGTGISIVANKIDGVRAALCPDAETARAARTWNQANVLALSNRLISTDRVVEILGAWLQTPNDDPKGAPGRRVIESIEAGLGGERA